MDNAINLIGTCWHDSMITTQLKCQEKKKMKREKNRMNLYIKVVFQNGYEIRKWLNYSNVVSEDRPLTSTPYIYKISKCI